MLIALTRAVSPSMERCELTHLEREPIDIARAIEQHASYEQALRNAGCAVRRLTSLPNHPDSVFVEDTAIVLGEVALITRPGAESRQGETTTTAMTLAEYRELLFIQAPGTIDGGDVLVAGKTIFVGRSGRSNQSGILQLTMLLRPYSYDVVPIEVTGCLHLKSAVTVVADDTLLINPQWVDRTAFGDWQFVEVDPDEPSAANALRVGGVVLFPSAYPRTAARLEALGIHPRTLDVSELAKAEGALTCCSLIFEAKKE